MALSLLFALTACAQTDAFDEADKEPVLPSLPPLYGTVSDTHGRGMAGVVMSNGYRCVQTDAAGNYRLEQHPEAQWVYCVTPSTHKIGVDATGYPDFFQPIASSATASHDFVLQPLNAVERSFSLYVIGDPQCKDARQVKRFINETVSDIRTTAQQSSTPVYGLVMGDIAEDNSALFADMRNALTATQVPLFTIIGNHDKDVVGGDARSSENFQKHFGPLNYSFNRGEVHFIGIDNVHFSSATKFTAGITDAQLEWIEQDLSFVPKNKMVVLYYHVPMRGSNDKNWQAVLRLLKPYANVRLMSAHTHYADHYYYSAEHNNIWEMIHPAAGGAWWFSTINGDGTPNGYTVYQFEGNQLVNHHYKSAGQEKAHQMRLHRGGDQTGGSYETFTYRVNTSAKFTDKTVIANIWNANKRWTVQISEAGGPLQKMYYLGQTVDSWSMGYHIGVIGRGHTAADGVGGEPGGNRKSFETVCKHIYYFEPQSADSPIRVVATDEYGNSYEATQFTPGKDYTTITPVLE